MAVFTCDMPACRPSFFPLQWENVKTLLIKSSQEYMVIMQWHSADRYLPRKEERETPGWGGASLHAQLPLACIPTLP